MQVARSPRSAGQQNSAFGNRAPNFKISLNAEFSSSLTIGVQRVTCLSKKDQRS
jgi:hypothetical protein